MPLDYLSLISDEASRIVDAYQRDPSAAVPWSDRWSVGTVARHVAGTHHVVAQIVEGRPDADFGLFNDLKTPAKGAPGFVDWFRAGTASLVGQLSSVPGAEACWSWFAPGSRVGWWARRMAFEAIIHGWDTAAAQGRDFSVASDVAADGIDEYLDVFVGTSRAGAQAPAGPTIGFECSDRDDRWWLDLSVPGDRAVSRDPQHVAVTVRATAEQLLLFVWGRVGLSDGGSVDVVGDREVLNGWPELVPPM